MKCDVWKPSSDQRRQDELWFSVWRFFEQSAFVNIQLLCYWPTIQNLISKNCPKFQVISSHFWRSMSCWVSIKQNLCKLKIFPLQSMWNAIRCIDQRFAFKNSGISCLAMIFNLNNQKTTVWCAKKSVAVGEILRVMYQFFPDINTNQRLSG